MTWIYGLVDPRGEYVRYVGKSDDPLRRYKGHIAVSFPATTQKQHWIGDIVDQDMLPVMIILEECSLVGWEERERWWIAYYGRENLVNGTDGGEGVYGMEMSNDFREKRRAYMTGRSMTDATKAKIAASHRGKKNGPLTAEHRAKISAGNTGNIRGRPSDETIERIRAGVQRRWDITNGRICE